MSILATGDDSRIQQFKQVWDWTNAQQVTTGYEHAMELAADNPVACGFSTLILADNLYQPQRFALALTALANGLVVGVQTATGTSFSPSAVLKFVLGNHEPAIPSAVYAPGLVGKTILITGAAGSIGSVLTQTLLEQVPGCRLVLLDNAETPLVALNRRLHARYRDRFSLYPGDICDAARMKQLGVEHAPHIVLHAAACKHVDLMEQHPAQAHHVNVAGTQTLLEAFPNSRFVLVSTDKAVDPQGVMGQTKRMAEGLVLKARAAGQTASLVRFGNVVGSNGSVIPWFWRLAKMGLPLPVTSPDITRYFISKEKAAQTILLAGGMEDPAACITRRDSEPVNIAQLAQLIARLQQQPVQINEVGLRPGEQLDEQLLPASLQHLEPNHWGCYLLDDAMAAE